jgi:hypothetical protein
VKGKRGTARDRCCRAGVSGGGLRRSDSCRHPCVCIRRCLSLARRKGFGIAGNSYIALVALWRGIAEGELPIEISREGVKYQQREVTSETAATLRELEVSVVRQDRTIRRIVNILDRHVGEVEAQGRALARLEARSKEVSPDDQARS